MKPLGFPLLTDENIHPEIIRRLIANGKDLRSVHDEGLAGHSDVEILRRAYAQGRVVLTHDGDFGELAIRSGEPIVGIIHLRPGHISSAFVMEIITAVESSKDDFDPPFIVVAERRADVVRVRARSLK